MSNYSSCGHLFKPVALQHLRKASLLCVWSYSHHTHPTLHTRTHSVLPTAWPWDTVGRPVQRGRTAAPRPGGLAGQVPLPPPRLWRLFGKTQMARDVRAKQGGNPSPHSWLTAGREAIPTCRITLLALHWAVHIRAKGKQEGLIRAASWASAEVVGAPRCW